MKLSILIPVYNEKKTLLKILKKVQKVDIGKIKKEIIIVDDFSNDGTRNILANLKGKNIKIKLNERNYGKGYSIKVAIKNATGDLIIIQDADFEYNPEDYKKLLKPILEKKTSVVYGSRFLGNNKFKKNMFYLGNLILSKLTSIIYFRKITDMETCYKLFKKEVIKGMEIKSKKFNFEPEITAKIINRGYKIFEVPISYRPRTKEEGKKIKMLDGVSALWSLLRYRFSK